MEKIIDLGQIQALGVFGCIENVLNRLERTEISNAKEDYVAGKLEEELDAISHEYSFRRSKLGFVAELESISVERQQKFRRILSYIDEQEFSLDNKMSMALTFATALNLLMKEDLEHLTEEEALLFCGAMMTVPLSDYSIHGQIFSNRDILSTISHRSPNFGERLEICYEISDYCDEFVEDNMSNLRYTRAVGDCVGIVQNFPVKEETKLK